MDCMSFFKKTNLYLKGNNKNRNEKYEKYMLEIAEREEERISALKKLHKHNICEECLTEQNIELKYSVYSADAGVCGHCLQKTDCWDLDLLDMYAEFGLKDDDVYDFLPRLRRDEPLKSIAQKIQKVLNIYSTSTDPTERHKHLLRCN